MPKKNVALVCALVLTALCGHAAPIAKPDATPANANLEETALASHSGFFNPQAAWEPGHAIPPSAFAPMSRAGFDYALVYSGAYLANVQGGINRGSVYNGILEADLVWDSEPLLGWNGPTFLASTLYAHGAKFSSNYVGDIYQGSSWHGGSGLRLYEVWLEQTAFDDRLSLRAGQLSADQEFFGTDVGVLFMNTTFGWPTILGFNQQTPAFPIATPGVRARLDLDHFWFQYGLYLGDSDPVSADGRELNQHGVRYNFHSDAFMLWEAGYTTATDQDRTPYLGVYKVGAWLHSGRFDDLYLDDQGDPLSGVPSGITTQIPREHHYNWGYYAIAEQKVWPFPNAREEEGVSLFARVATAPKDRNLIDYYLDGGIHVVGLIPGRSRDVTGVAISYSHITRKRRNFTRETNETRDLFGDPHIPIEGYESVLEFTHRIEIKPWWFVQPDLQYIIHPGGSTQIQDALVLAISSTVSF